MRFKIITLLLSALLLTSCGIFTPDTTPAMQAHQAELQVSLSVLDSFENIVTNATGISEEQRTALTTKISESRRDILRFAAELNEYLDSVGDINWQELVKDGFDFWKIYKDSQK